MPSSATATATAPAPAGPYRTLTSVEGEPFPYYIVPFDEDGLCAGPATQAHLLDHAAGYSDVFVFSHGWNNDWRTATERFESFITGFQQQRRSLGLAMPAGYKPLLVGVFWPSQALEWFDSETGPGFAGTDPALEDAAAQASNSLLNEVARALPAAQRERFFALAQAPSLDEAGARELADLLAGVLATTHGAADGEGVRPEAPRGADLLAAAQALSATSAEPDWDAVGTIGGANGEAPQAAGWSDIARKLDPRQLLKPFTVWQMKDRAGKVGARGVKALLEGLLKRSEARVHVLGHSYGCKVVITAASALPDGLRPLHSALLLQPAVSQYAFSTTVPERTGVSGGFVPALRRVKTPVVATFSANDSALTRGFHLALRRHDDLGEQPTIAGTTASLYGALGGFGPQEDDAVVIDIHDPKQPYAWPTGGRLVGVRGTRTISGHGDISNPSTWWLAYCVATAAAG